MQNILPWRQSLPKGTEGSAGNFFSIFVTSLVGVTQFGVLDPQGIPNKKKKTLLSYHYTMIQYAYLVKNAVERVEHLQWEFPWTNIFFASSSVLICQARIHEQAELSDWWLYDVDMTHFWIITMTSHPELTWFCGMAHFSVYSGCDVTATLNW